MKKQFTIYFFITTFIFINFFILGGQVYAGETYSYLMPDKPIIESFCDNKGNCVCSSFAEPNSSCSASSNTTVHVGETLNFTIKVSGEETSGVLAFIFPQEYDWVKEGGIKPWGTDLTYTKTFSTEDISARYFMYAYIKSSNDNYHRRSSGCMYISYSCDDNAQIIYTVLPSTASLPTCTAFNYSGWSTCQFNGTQTRTVISSSPNDCSGGNPTLTQSCIYTPPICISWTYSDWSACVNGQQTRTIISSQPANCAGGDPILSQSCNSTPSCTENNWTSMLSPTICPSNGQQTRKWTKVGECQGGISRPSEETVSCDYQVPTCTNFTYSDWGICSSSGVQSRTMLSTSPSGCAGGNPILNKSCNYIAPCTSDIWSCEDWSNCSTNGSQTRICTKTFDCPDVQTASPITNQHCEISNKPTTQQTTQNNSDEILNQNLITNSKDVLSVSTKNQNSQNESIRIKNSGQEINQEKNTTGSQVAEQKRSEVASAVQEMLQVAERDSGVGQQVKIIAQTQTQNQEKLKTSLQKVQSRSGLAKFFVGPNYGEINNAKKLLEQNREQIKQLDQVKNQFANQGDQQKLTEQVQLLEQANQKIENSLNTSQKGFSLFGWMFRLFAK